MMVVTNIITRSIEPKEHGVCGEFSITLDDSLCIHKILVINGSKGLFIAFPHAYTKEGVSDNRRFVDIVHPTENSLRQHIQTEVLTRYNEELELLSK